jgi:hypothetical protein
MNQRIFPKQLLIVLCIVGTLWSLKMIFAAAQMTNAEGVFPPLFAWELFAFFGAATLPLLFIWKPRVQPRALILTIWALCIVYVSVLALNLIRVGLVANGCVRLALWVAIAFLFIRMLRLSLKNA